MAGFKRLKELFSSALLLNVSRNLRYVDIGDWNDRIISSAPCDDPRSEAAILVHELVEYILCTYDGISAKRVDAEDARILARKLRKNKACYWRQHLVATRIEREVVKALGMTWEEHSRICERSFRAQEEKHRENEGV